MHMPSYEVGLDAHCIVLTVIYSACMSENSKVIGDGAFIRQRVELKIYMYMNHF